jgi:hypothetical protein
MMTQRRKNPVRLGATAKSDQTARRGATRVMVCAIVAAAGGAASQSRADITVNTNGNNGLFILSASAYGGPKNINTNQDGVSNFIELDAPPGFTSFTPDTTTGTLSQSGTTGSASGSAKGFANASFT